MVEVIAPLKLAYIPIRKVATTSIRQEFRRVGSMVGGHSATADIKMSPYIRYRARNCDVFAIVREPASRFLSAYSNRIFHHDDMRSQPSRRIATAAFGLNPQPDIEEFCARFHLYYAVNDSIRRHFRLQSAYLGQDLNFYSDIFPLSRVSQFQDILSSRSGLEVEFGRLQTGGPKFKIADMPAKVRDFIMKFSEPDYKLLGHLF